MNRSITLRLVVTFAVTALSAFALMGAVLYAVLEREMTRHEADELNTRLLNVEYSVQRIGTLDRWPYVVTRLEALTARDGSLRFWVLSDDPRFRFGEPLAAVEHDGSDADGLGQVRVPGRQRPLRTLSRTMPPLLDRPAVRLVVGIDPQPYELTLHRFRVAVGLVALAAAVVMAAAGFAIARAGLFPLRRLSKEAQALSPRNLAQRLETAALPVELSTLAQAFNGALSRLEGAYTQLEAFNADVAHELRTPLANLIGSTQVALSRQRPAAELEEAMQSNLEELERLRAIVNDMLFLARADQGEVATGLVDTPLADEVRKTIEFFEVVLDETGCTIAVEGDLAARAPIETSLFRRALTNLVQNAIQHSAPGSALSVRLDETAAQVRVTVRNPGAPIAPRHLDRLFDRFYRVDTARDGHRQGYGLGLAIVKAVARMHGGEVGAESHGGTTAIGFSVPRRAVAADTG